jgi:hypothetical protein
MNGRVGSESIIPHLAVKPVTKFGGLLMSDRGRPRIHGTNAERQRAYRQRVQEAKRIIRDAERKQSDAELLDMVNKFFDRQKSKHCNFLLCR